MFSVALTVYAGNMLAMILVGTLSPHGRQDGHHTSHAFMIYTILSGVAISSFTGAGMYISLADIPEVHGKSETESRDRSSVVSIILWHTITAILTASAIFFWVATLVAISSSHVDVIAIGSVAILCTILLTIAAFRVTILHLRRKSSSVGDISLVRRDMSPAKN